MSCVVVLFEVTVGETCLCKLWLSCFRPSIPFLVCHFNNSMFVCGGFFFILSSLFSNILFAVKKT